METLKKEKEDLNRSLEQARSNHGEELRTLEAKVREGQTEVAALRDRLNNKDEMLKSTEKRLETATKSE